MGMKPRIWLTSHSSPPRVVAGHLGLDQHAFVQVGPVAHVGGRLGKPQIVQPVVGVEPLDDHLDGVARLGRSWETAARARNPARGRPVRETPRRAARRRRVQYAEIPARTPLRLPSTSPPRIKASNDVSSRARLSSASMSCGNVSSPLGPGGKKGTVPICCEAPFGPFRQMGTVPFFPRRGNALSDRSDRRRRPRASPSESADAAAAVDVAVGVGRRRLRVSTAAPRRGSNRVDAGGDRPPDRAASR